jgi:uncharacterized integral membrane protein
MGTKSFYYIVLSLAAVLGVLVLAMAAQNGQVIPFNLFGNALPLSLGGSMANQNR